TPTTVHTPSALTLDENTSAHLHVHAFDFEQPTLSFVWELPATLTFTGSRSTITVKAPAVTAYQQFTCSVTV
ncbi:hypothetical protein CWC21_22390, partial [Pseudoalteromonas phenolica]